MDAQDADITCPCAGSLRRKNPRRRMVRSYAAVVVDKTGLKDLLRHVGWSVCRRNLCRAPQAFIIFSALRCAIVLVGMNPLTRGLA